MQSEIPSHRNVLFRQSFEENISSCGQTNVVVRSHISSYTSQVNNENTVSIKALLLDIKKNRLHLASKLIGSNTVY